MIAPWNPFFVGNTHLQKCNYIFLCILKDNSLFSSVLRRLNRKHNVGILWGKSNRNHRIFFQVILQRLPVLLWWKLEVMLLLTSLDLFVCYDLTESQTVFKASVWRCIIDEDCLPGIWIVDRRILSSKNQNLWNMWWEISYQWCLPDLVRDRVLKMSTNWVLWGYFNLCAGRQQPILSTFCRYQKEFYAYIQTQTYSNIFREKISSFPEKG